METRICVSCTQALPLTAFHQHPPQPCKHCRRTAQRTAARHTARARRVGARVTAPIDRAAIITREGGTCYLCRRYIPNVADMTLDHIVPLAKGGDNSPANIRIACRACNSRKGAKSLDTLLDTEGW